MNSTAISFITYLILFIPLLCGVLTFFLQKPFLRNVLSITASLLLFFNVMNFLMLAMRGMARGVTLVEFAPNLSIMFLADPLSALFMLVSSLLWVVTTFYAIGYMRANKEAHLSRFYGFFALSLFATMGIALAGNLFTLFIFYELLTLFTYPLVVHSGTEEAKRAGRTYLYILLGTSMAFLLPAVLWTWYVAGSLNFEPGGVLAGKASPLVTGILLALYVFGVSKAAVMPFHRWLPAAMVAPAPVSALLHAVAVVKAGVFTLLKVVVYIFGTSNLLMLSRQEPWVSNWMVYVAGVTVVLASLKALRQGALKLRLAYSTVSQLSYIVMATALSTKTAIMAACFHIVAHACSKITLFFAAGSIYTAQHKSNVSEMRGIGRTMPFTMAAFTVGALAMIGIPPTVGFLSKFYLSKGAFESEHYFAVLVIFVSTLLNAAYFLPIIHQAYFLPPREKSVMKEAPAIMVFANLFVAFLVIVLFFVPDTFVWLSKLVAGE
ncbi:MAG: monovalent cation/H+ antiporter subunit D family protein [Proteobacteria bacterium]|nr:monovalent cation/H+ antiporter subunit D family protein [Pseudomonadota bacterium]